MGKMTFNETMETLKSKARPEQLDGMARFGIGGAGRLGVSMPEIRALAKTIKKDHELALKLWETKIPDAMILAAIVDDPGQITKEQLESWVVDINAWDVCDQLCMTMDKLSFAPELVREWSVRDEEFVKRAAYALIACLAWHAKQAPDEDFIGYLDIIKAGSTDERNFVRKAVNWALRNIGKRNMNLNKEALVAAREIKDIDSKAARWIAADAIRELESEPIQARLLKK
jgi:3-methyladenine DNA glycosylase AlkD